MRVLPSERLISGNGEGAPLPDSHSELPPIIRRTEFVAYALAGLLLIAVIGVLYFAKAFFLPVVMAVVASQFAAIISVSGGSLLLALLDTPDVRRAIAGSGGLAEGYIMPFMMIIPALIVGGVGSAAASLGRRMLRT